jgi:MFS family permease
MNLTGYLVIDHGHHQSDVFTVISLHIVGMYALVLVIGWLVDRIGRRPGQVTGLAVMGVSTVALGWFNSVFWMSAALFLLGLGWNVSYVAAVTELSDRSLPNERGRLIGLTDQLSSAAAVVLVLLGGVVYSELGVEALAAGATVCVVVPAAWILLRSAAGAPDVRPLSDEDLQRQTG